MARRSRQDRTEPRLQRRRHVTVRIRTSVTSTLFGATASLPPLPHHTGAAAGLSGGRHLGCSRSGSFFAERPRRRPSKRVGSSGASVSHSLLRPLPHGARGVQSSSPHALTCDRRCPGQSGWGKSCEGERSPWQLRHPHGRGPAPELTKPGWRILRDIATRSLTLGSC
jgi:hypothetical protein